MSLTKINPRNSMLLLFIALTAVLRIAFNFSPVLSPLSNFSPLGAMALFGGAYFQQRTKGFLLPLLMLFLSDFVLHQTVFKPYSNGILYSGWYWVYGAFVLMGITGRMMLKEITAMRILFASLTCVIIHWIVSDIGVWMGSAIYPQNAAGFIACLIAAIPFEANFLAGTLAYSIILFGAFEWLQRRNIVLQTAG